MSSVDEQIQKAIAEGKFQDLQGKGKPLKLDENPLEDPEWRLANQVLRNAGYSLPWIEQRQQIESELEEARAELRRAWEWRQQAQGQAPIPLQEEWQRAVERFRARAAQTNKRIFDYNLQAPTLNLHLFKVEIESEIEQVMNRPL
jgi:DnaJ homolog subfamily C member 28